MNRFHAAFVCLLASATVVSAEGIPGLSVAEKESRDLILPLAAPNCPTDEAGWIQWRDQAIKTMLTVSHERNGEKFVDVRATIKEADKIDIFISGCTKLKL